MLTMLTMLMPFQKHWYCSTTMKQLLVHRVLTSVASASVHDFLHEDDTKSTRQKIFWFFCKMF
jgi:hypothetical protein